MMHRRDWLKRFSLAAAAAVAPAGAVAQAEGKPRLRTAICAYSFRDELGQRDDESTRT